ncbi:hypothetical protein F511_11261 [Dorcoceras hygrometricum]|uniref:Uncharacterized protein n=1 Tax=Dorcoceras hygrometricum TaxID=472368 RepID=A0A2Z7CD11_9LAMI|nr:hypothetical protein F511_11261 [Dorcoceras hygrometricum]
MTSLPASDLTGGIWVIRFFVITSTFKWISELKILQRLDTGIDHRYKLRVFTK